MKQDYSQLIKLISNQKENFPLDQQFYTDPNIYNIDLETFFYNQLDLFNARDYLW